MSDYVDEDTGEIIEGEIEGDEQPDLVPYRPQIVLAPEEAKAQADAIREGVSAVLRENVDYGKIPGAGDKPVLLKPGAEWLLKWFGLVVHEMEERRIDTQGERPFGVTYRARVGKVLPSGETITVAVCDGYAGYDERKFKSNNYTAPWNTVIKMAQKRALVGATLIATGTSGLFTQDLEDYQHEHPRSGAPTTGSGGGGGDTPQVRNPDDPPSDKQIGFLHSIIDENDIADDVYRGALKAIYGVESSKELTKGQISGLIDGLLKDDVRERFVSRGLAAVTEGDSYE